MCVKLGKHACFQLGKAWVSSKEPEILRPSLWMICKRLSKMHLRLEGQFPAVIAEAETCTAMPLQLLLFFLVPQAVKNSKIHFSSKVQCLPCPADTTKG